MSDVFISYSRKDKAFVQQLDEALKQRQREAWVDWEGIPPTAEFMPEIYGAIEGAHTFIFVLTPDSIASEVCGMEIAHAVAQNKRMVPIVKRDVNAAEVPEALAKLNWIFFRDSDPFQAATDTLITALDTDLDWVRMHTRLLTRAVEWQAKGRNDSFALRGVDLRAAEQWLTKAGADKERQPTQLQAEYILASRKAATRRQRTILGGISCGIIVAIVLGIAAWLQHSRAIEQEQKARAERSQTEFSHASAWLETGDGAEALRDLARSLESNPANSQAATRLINLLGQRQWPHLVAQQNCGLPVGLLKTNEAGDRLILATRSAGGEGEMHMEPQSIYFYDTEALSNPKSVKLECYEIADLQVSGDRALVTGSRSNIAALLDVQGGAVLKNWKADYGIDFRTAFSSDGSDAIVWATGEAGNSPSDAAGTKLEISSAADGALRFAPPRFPVGVRAVAMNDAELRALTEDGKATIQTLKTGKAARAQPFPVAQELPGYAAFLPDGTAVVGVTKDGLKVWPVSPSENNPAEPLEYPSKGLAKFQMDSFHPENKIAGVFGDDDAPLTFLAQDPRSSSASARSCLTQLAPDSDGGVKITADWQSPFAPIALLDTGLAVAQDTKAFVLPFHGGAFSGTVRHETEITAICGLQEGLLATGSADGAVKLWRLTDSAFPAPQQTSPAPEEPDEAILWQSPSHDVEIRQEESGDYVIRHGDQAVKIEMPAALFQQSISSFELSNDGEWGIVSGFREDGRGGAGSGAWIFRAKDGKLLSGKVGPCEWAGFSPDRRQVLTIEFGRLTFWNLEQDEKGLTTFAKATPQFAQLGLAGAGVAANGQRVATRSSSGDVIVWDKTEGSPLQTLKRDSLWSDVDLDSTEPNPSEDLRPQTISCRPALNADGRLLATAYGRGFVIWDVDSGRPLCDPIFCDAPISRLEFAARESTRIQATLRDGSVVEWEQPRLESSPGSADVSALQRLAVAVADDTWLDEAPKLATSLHPASPAVAKLVEHFATHARALRGTPASTVSPDSK